MIGEDFICWWIIWLYIEACLIYPGSQWGKNHHYFSKGLSWNFFIHYYSVDSVHALKSRGEPSSLRWIAQDHVKTLQFLWEQCWGSVATRFVATEGPLEVTPQRQPEKNSSSSRWRLSMGWISLWWWRRCDKHSWEAGFFELVRGGEIYIIITILGRGFH